jgi:plasmid replication initiation protein
METSGLKLDKKVRHSNSLIQSPYSQEFSIHEIKIFEIGCASIQADDILLINKKNNKSLSFNNHELAKLLNTKANVISMEIENIAVRLMNKKIHLRKITNADTLEFELINIIPYAEYKNGVFNFEINYRVLPYLLELNSNFTEFKLNNLLILNSAYGIKLYKLLYQYKNIKSRSFQIDELKEQFGISNKYNQYYDFRKWIIDPSVKQINEYTDLNVSYNEIKVGRKVDKLAFNFELKKQEKIKPSSNQDIHIPVINMNEGLLVEKFEEQISSRTKSMISQYQQEKGNNYVEVSIDYAKRNAKTNFDKYLADTLTNGWAEVEIKKSKAKKDTKTAKVMTINNESEKKRLEKEQENLAKSEIEHEWSKLLDSEKQNYLNYTDFILNKYAPKLTSLPALDQRLPLCIYAVSNDKFYDRSLELYMKNMLNISLNINNFVIKE